MKCRDEKLLRRILRSEERHLRVVGDGPTPAVSGVVVRDSGRSVFVVDLADAVELDRRAQRVAHRSAQKTASEMLQCSLASWFIGVVLHFYLALLIGLRLSVLRINRRQSDLQ